MEQEKLDRAIRYVLRYAIEHNGKAYFNPCMYYLGFADNIQPPKSFDDELNKYGEIHYDTIMISTMMNVTQPGHIFKLMIEE